MSDLISREKCNQLADHLEAYVDGVSSFVIFSGKKAKKIKKAEERVMKAVKDLRKGKIDKVFDMEKLEEEMENDRMFFR